MANYLKVLAIETSCDETAVAIVDSEKNIIANNIHSQSDEHQKYSGVVPEIAARSHIRNLDRLVEATMQHANLDYSEIDAVAATAGPGLIGGLIVGVTMAKAIADVAKKPFLAVNHLEGHALVACLTDNVGFPFLLLLISGGHCQIVICRGLGQYQVLGSTIDDALGEAFDKVAQMLGLAYPGGPAVEARAAEGDKGRFALPRPIIRQRNLNFSFSGLKTATRLLIDSLGELSDQDINDICAAFQLAVGDVLENRVHMALQKLRSSCPQAKTLVISGGVAANQYLRERLLKTAEDFNIEMVAPPVGLCTDNAAMIGWVGIEKLKGDLIDDLSFAPKARWRLDSLA
ncbi:tRNA N6-adenosine threonylcarbamoyltransferase [Rickettsiales bacterium]|nr:tRNA N6-adenosine threonylcarbamoyltransferase [Rickettsiales bacterium]